MVGVALIEDDVNFLSKVEALINRQLEMACVFRAVHPVSLIEQEEIVPDVVLLDLMLGEESGLNYIEAIKEQFSKVRIIVLTGRSEEAYFLEALQKGADSYFLKGSSPTLLIEAIRQVSSGGMLTDPRLTPLLVDAIRKERLQNQLQDIFHRQGLEVTNRELRIIHLLFQGKTYQEVANHCFITVNTVRYYVKSIYSKLEVHSKTALVQKIQDLLVASS